MKFVTWFKLKFAVSVALLLAGGAAVVAISQTSGREELTAQEIAQQTQDAYDALWGYSDLGTVIAESGGVNTKAEFSIYLLRPNSCRVDWLQTTGGRYTSRGNVWSAGSENFVILATAGQKATYLPQKANDMKTALAMGAQASELACCTIPRIFYSQDYGETLGLPASGGCLLEKELDERLGGVDCYVLRSVTVPAKLPGQGALPESGGKLKTTTTYWIGKRDHVIHQARTTMAGATMTETHRDIVVNPDGLSAYFVHR
jgi:hypothetical protein